MMDEGGVGGDGVDGWDRRWRLLVDELLFELVRREERCRARVWWCLCTENGARQTAPAPCLNSVGK